MVMQKGVLQSGSLTGFLFLFLAVLAAVGYSVVVKKLTDNYHPVTITLYQNIFGMLAFAPLFFIYDFSSVINIVPSSEIIITLLLLSFFSSTLAFVFFTYSVREIGVSRTSVFSNAIPVVTALLAFLYLGETLSLQKITGIILVIAGVTISQVKTTKKIELQ
ncbi:MAG: DMT family transporter [Bacteroidota bacterium]